MKKIILILMMFIILCFLIPIIFSKKFESKLIYSEQEKAEVKNETEKINEIQVNKNYNYNDYTNIKLLHTANNEKEEINLEEYLCNVVSAEIPAYYEKEALKAQAIVARTYTIYTIIKNKGKHDGADICDSPNCCQAWISKEDRMNKWEEDVRTEYWNRIVEAVNSTIGEVIVYDGRIINAVYHANSGGRTEIASGVWSGGDYPYLQSVETSRRRCISTI